MAESFFEFRERVTAAKSGGAPPASDAMTVSQLTAVIDQAIKAGVPGVVTVRGEVSNVSDRQASGHLYFTMKDAGACINCVMWRDNASKLRFRLEDGLEVIAIGRVTLYAPQGRYQLTVQRLEPAGRGALELAFRQLHARLAAEGLFDPERKKPVPKFPRRIAMVTSRATAALQDMLKVLKNFPWLELMVYHVPVQGDGSGAKIADAIAHLNRRGADIGGVDVILLARGGGSLEDLWAFNEESVARAIAASRIPIVTGIGHEIDSTISDLAADYHAHTPTEAAQVVAANWKRAADSVAQAEVRLRNVVRQIAVDCRSRLEGVARHEFFRRPMDRIQLLRQLLDDRGKSMTLALTGRMMRYCDRIAAIEPRIFIAGKQLVQIPTARLEAISRQLEALSPQGVLGRGYTITTVKKTGEILCSEKSARPGDRILTRFADGEIESQVQDSGQPELFE
jgi:exodeoxyribonuclease VII large subunit